jgi:2-dehydro-3-deoxygluconokinase
MADPVPHTRIRSADNCRWDAVALGEAMLRLDPRDVPVARMRDAVRVFQGGGETNVACGLAYTFGLRAAVLTALVADDIGANIRNQLREAGVDTGQIVWWDTKAGGGRRSTDQKGTLHNGINFTYAGAGVLESSTLYYRAHTPATRLEPGDFDWERLFAQEGVRVFATGGIFTLIGPRTAELALEAAHRAAAHGVFVAADLNYRSKVEPDKGRAQEINRKLAPWIGFLVGNDSDLSDALGYETRAGKNASFEEWLAAYQATVKKVTADFPNLSLIGTQWREATSADQVGWGAALYDPRADRCTWRRCAARCPSATAPAAATPSPPGCWPPCWRGRTWTRPWPGARRTASWCRKPPGTSPWSAAPRWRPRRNGPPAAVGSRPAADAAQGGNSRARRPL